MFWYTKELGLGQGQYQVIIYELTRGVTFRNFYYAHVSAINFYFFYYRQHRFFFNDIF